MNKSIYIASKSPRRLELLLQIGIKPIVIDPKIVEKKLASESPHEFVKRMAKEKAEAGFEIIKHQTPMPVLGADTIVLCDDQVMGKPRDRKDGIAMLSLLSGRTHQVITSVALKNAMQIKQCLVESEVTFCNLSLAQIETYWQTGEPHDKAGAYAIQGFAASFITNLRGSYSAVVGLPLFETRLLLHDFGVDIF